MTKPRTASCDSFPLRQWLPIEEAAKKIGVSRRWLQRGLRDGIEHERRKVNPTGRPLTFVEMGSAKAWCGANGVKVGMRTPAEGQKVGDMTAEQKEQKIAEWHKKEGFKASQERLQKAETFCWALYWGALRSGDTTRIAATFRAWQDARRELRAGEAYSLDIERIHEKEWQETRKALDEFCERIRVFLDSSPRMLAILVNPANPAHAEKALRDWLNTQLYPMLSQPFP